MDIVSDLPFQLQVIQRFPTLSCQSAQCFCTQEDEVRNEHVETLSVEENDDIEILFDSEDPQARLYLEALEIMPIDDHEIGENAAGELYRRPSPKPFFLYRTNAGYDALRVDTFRLAVFCRGSWYYGSFVVKPKPMSEEEWQMMKDELEKEMTGLAKDLMKKSLGAVGENLPLQSMHDFYVIQNYAQSVMTALLDITQHPRCEIKTTYRQISSSRSHAFDAETMKRYAIKSGSEATWKVPQKTVCYDIQDNRILKKIIREYEKRLGQFLELLADAPLGKERTEFLLLAQRLKKMTSILKTKEWYLQVSDVTQPYLPHSFLMDARYNILYQMYQELQKKEFHSDLHEIAVTTWKRSSYLYEMWCYLKICRLLTQKFSLQTSKNLFSEKKQCFFLESGATMVFENDCVRLHLVYDEFLPTSRENTSIEKPLFMAKPQEMTRIHNRPDMLLHIYQKERGWYLGTLVLECKYRKLNSFWCNDSQRSSLGQLETYYNNARSDYLFGTFGKRLSMRPVRKVIVLTPDVRGEGRENEDFHIRVKSFKPSNTHEMEESLKNELFENISDAESIYKDLLFGIGS
ncbi:MAG: DUF2357 domain-containing protein [Lachnospiraceae bacterium]